MPQPHINCCLFIFISVFTMVLGFHLQCVVQMNLGVGGGVSCYKYLWLMGGLIFLLIQFWNICHTCLEALLCQGFTSYQKKTCGIFPYILDRRCPSRPWALEHSKAYRLFKLTFILQLALHDCFPENTCIFSVGSSRAINKIPNYFFSVKK